MPIHATVSTVRLAGTIFVAMVSAGCGGAGGEGAGGNSCSNGQNVFTSFSYANATSIQHVGTPISSMVPTAPGIPASCLPSTSYSLSSGALPAGITLDARTGVISGAPTAAGRYLYEVRLSLEGFAGSVWSGQGFNIDDPALFTFSRWTGHRPPASDDLRLDTIGGKLLVTSSYSNTMNAFLSGDGGASWSPVQATGPTPPPTKRFSGTSDGTAVYLSGGTTASGEYASHVWKFDGTSWSQRTAAAAFGGRRNHAMAKVGATLFVVGGSNAQGYLGDVWKSDDDGANWTLASTPFAPRASACAMSFGGNLLVIGGSNSSTNLNEVWESVDGATWNQRPSGPSVSPFMSVTAWSQQCAALNGRVYFLSDYHTVSSQNLTDWQFEPGFLDNSPAPGAVALNGRLYAIGQQGTTSCQLMESIP
jgi:hypothetical protein